MSQPSVAEREMRVISPHLSRARTHGGQLLLDEMVTKRYPLDDLAVAFDDMRRRRIAEGVIVFD